MYGPFIILTGSLLIVTGYLGYLDNSNEADTIWRIAFTMCSAAFVVVCVWAILAHARATIDRITENWPVRTVDAKPRRHG